MAAQNRIRVMIVDDHAMVRSGLRMFLASFPDLALAGEAEDGEQAVEAVTACEPDVVLMDMAMPGMGGAAATERILQSRPQARVIALTSFYDKELVEAAVRNGAISYVLKNVSAEELAQAIRAAHAGRPTLAPEAAAVLIESTRRESGPGSRLTDREREVLALIIDGLTNPAIAQRLSISESTAKFHVSSILSKLGARNRVEAVRLAGERGLTSPRRDR